MSVVRASLLVVLAMAFALPAVAWDGDWTQAESGTSKLYDPGSSEGQGVKDHDPHPQKYFIPPARQYYHVDPEELKEYEKSQDYSPHTLARFPFNVHYQGIRIRKGYYQVKAGDASDGSPAVHLASAAPGNLTLQGPGPSASKSGTQRSKTQGPLFQTFVLKKLGRVVAVLPIEGSEPYVRRKGEKLPKDALAWVDVESLQPVLKLYYKKRIYHTRLSPDYAVLP